MIKGSIVVWKNEPTINTPGYPGCPFACTGSVVGDRYSESPHYGGEMNDHDPWCDVFWSNNQVTKCYKKDLKVVA